MKQNLMNRQFYSILLSLIIVLFCCNSFNNANSICPNISTEITNMEFTKCPNDRDYKFCKVSIEKKGFYVSTKCSDECSSLDDASVKTLCIESIPFTPISGKCPTCSDCSHPQAIEATYQYCASRYRNYCKVRKREKNFFQFKLNDFI
jgi:hypothetical protein